MEKEKRRKARRSQRRMLANFTRNFNYSLEHSIVTSNFRKNQHIQNDEFQLTLFTNVSSYDYKSYKITYRNTNKIIGYMGLFNSGVFNYVIYDDSDMLESRFLIFIKSYIKDLGLNPVRSFSTGKIPC